MDKNLKNVTRILRLTTLNQTTTESTYDDIGAVTYMVVIILMFAFGIMLMIGAQVARGESSPGLNKYMKQMNSIRDNAVFDRNKRILENRKKSSAMEGMGALREKDLEVIDEVSLHESALFMGV